MVVGCWLKFNHLVLTRKKESFGMDRLPMKRKSKVSGGKVVVPKQRKVVDRGYEVLTQESRSGQARSESKILEESLTSSG